MGENPEKPQKPEKFQTTEKGHEIPVPSREDFLRDLKKVAPPVPVKKQKRP